MILVEAAVADLADARSAAAAGAHRLELCAELEVGGTTPDIVLFDAVRQAVPIPVHMMVRPRSGGFHYSPAELDAMHSAVVSARERGASGVVLGVLDAGGRVDRVALRRLQAAARPLPVTFHRAFDAAADPYAALETLLELEVDRVLSGGGPGPAAAGIAVLRDLVAIAAGRLAVMAGGGVRGDHVARLVRETGVGEIHLRAGPGGEWVRGVVEKLRVES